MYLKRITFNWACWMIGWGGTDLLKYHFGVITIEKLQTNLMLGAGIGVIWSLVIVSCAYQNK